MIASDQPRCFPSDLLVALSSKTDGTMLDRANDFHAETIMRNRQAFCEAAGANYRDCVYQLIRYNDQQTFDKLTDVSRADVTGRVAERAGDVLFTEELGVGLFLPVADCVATVVYDPTKHFLALMHMGRHSTLTEVIAKTVQYFAQKGSKPQDLLVWMSPSAKKDTYRLEWFDYDSDLAWRPFLEKKDGGIYLDLPGYNRQRFLEAGILPDHITISPVDTMKDDRYFLILAET